MTIILYYDNTTKMYYTHIRKNGKIIHSGFDTEKEAIGYLLDYCEELHTYLLRA